MKKPFLLAIAILPVLAAAPLASASEQTKARQASKSTYDPNQIICSRARESGSRVLARRTCMRASEWETFRREQRQAIDRAQTSRTWPGQ